MWLLIRIYEIGVQVFCPSEPYLDVGFFIVWKTRDFGTKFVPKACGARF